MRSPGRSAGPADDVDGPVDVFLPRYRGVPEPAATVVARRPSCASRTRGRRTGVSEVTILDVAADGYRLRLVDHPAAFDRDGFYGDAAGDYADNAWRFGLFCRAALEALRADGRPVDVLHLHDWHAGPAAIFRDAALRRRSDRRAGGDRHDAPQPRLSRLDRRRARSRSSACARRRRAGAGRRRDRPAARPASSAAELVNTVSPGFARRGADARVRDGPRRRCCARRATGSSGSSTASTRRSGTRRRTRDTGRAVRRAPIASGKAACRADLLTRVGFDPADAGPVIGMIGRLDPQKGFDLLAGAAPDAARARRAARRPGQRPPVARRPVPRARRRISRTRVALIERFDRAMARRDLCRRRLLR